MIENLNRDELIAMIYDLKEKYNDAMDYVAHLEAYLLEVRS